MCNERFNYCLDMGFDALGLTELHNVQNKKLWKCKRWITSDDSEVDEQGNNLDPASGVGILLSKRFSELIMAQGSIGSRIVWVRINGPVCPLFIICVYIPHKHRTQPDATSVLTQLNDFIANCEKIKKTDCIIMMGDFNCELQRNIKGCTGKWLMNKRADNGHSKELVNVMRAHDLFAIDSMFKPKRSNMFQKQRKRVCSATYLQKDPTLRPSKLDYFLVSNRWRSCVTNSKTAWAPSFHRFGKAFDHIMLRIDWIWRIKSDKRPPMRDYKAMGESAWCKLNNCILTNLNAEEGSTYDIPTGALGKEAEVVIAATDYMTKCINKAIEECVPTRTKSAVIKRRVSEKTRSLYEKRTRKFSAIAAAGGKISRSMRRRWNDQIKKANLADYNDWLERMTKDMEAAYERGDTEAIFEAVRKISGTAKSFTSKAPTKTKTAHGEDTILDHNELANLWQNFLTGKFKETEAEIDKRAYEAIGEQINDDPLTKAAFLRAIKKLKNGKACGPDCIPGEVFKHCDAASTALFQILCKMWELEFVPPKLVRAAFIMLFKNKGSVDDPTKYRCLGLLPHAYKVLSIVLLERITHECSGFLADWQAGFRPLRGCRDNILLLRVLIDNAIKNNTNMCVTFIDYSAAFDTVSHKFLDESLAAAGASRKTRAMFRAIYHAAEGMAKIRGLNGKTVYSQHFEVRRGVIQGDIISPIFFVLAMEQIFRLHDHSADGITVGNHLHVGTLGYADDVAIISESPARLSERVTSISKGSEADADMQISIKKTKSLHIAKQEKVQPSTTEEIEKTESTYEFACSFCPRRFKTKRGRNIHRARCDCQHGLADKEDEVEGIIAAFGTPAHRWYRVQWVGSAGKDTWEPERSLQQQGCGDSIRDFWLRSDQNPSEDFIPDPTSWRCYKCGKGYKSESTLAAHITRKHPRRQSIGSTADRDTRHQKRKDAQAARPTILCEGKPLENVWAFKYLGSWFSADGNHLTDVKAKVARATKTAGKMRNIWASKHVPLQLKLRIYKTGVCSQLAYGSEAWLLNADTIRIINGVNSRMLHRITGKTIHEEASSETRTFDIIAWIRARRLQWVGHIIRMKPDERGNERLLHLAVKHIHQNRVQGDLLSDVPNFEWEELKQLANNRDAWRDMVRNLRDGNGVHIVMAPSSTHNMTTRRRRRTTEAPITQTSITTAAAAPAVPATSTANAKKYRNRDAHETFFRPKAAPEKSKTSSKNMKQKKKKGLTDKQRAKEAHAHWVIHHGVARDAEQFLKLKANTNNVSVETLAALNLMITNPFERATVNPPSPPVELTWTTATGAEVEH